MASKDNDDTPDDISFGDVMNYQIEKTGNLLDYSQKIVLACRKQANDWQAIAQAFFKCASDAQDLAESCALAARIAADRVGDIISTEFDIREINEDEEEEENEDDVDDTDPED